MAYLQKHSPQKVCAIKGQKQILILVLSSTIISPWVDYGQLHWIKVNLIRLQNYELPRIQFRSWITCNALQIQNGATSDTSEESCTISRRTLRFQPLLSVVDLFWGETGVNKCDWMRTDWNSFTEDQIDTSQTLSCELHINHYWGWCSWERGTHGRNEMHCGMYTNEQLQ